jgi:flagellar basal-body rod modification protein FlgD
MITDTVATTLTNAATPTPTTSAISSDFNTFLRMLTVQLENQDPLNPVQSSDYAMQLATFSGVEQQVLTNDLLKSMSGQMALTGLSTMAAWVGQEVRVAAPAAFSGTPITLAPQVPAAADRAEIVVRDSAGQIVQVLNVRPGQGPMDWAGVTTDGQPLPNGTYAFNLVSYRGDAVLSDVAVDRYARVQEVRVDNGQNLVILPGGISVPSSAVTALRAPGS